MRAGQFAKVRVPLGPSAPSAVETLSGFPPFPTNTQQLRPNMSNREYFRINEPSVISEALDGELILVHFESGCYYSVRGIGADICQLLTAGWSLEHVCERAAHHFGKKRNAVEAEMQSFVKGLVAEQLLVANSAPQVAPSVVTFASREYGSPSFEKFDDMADQLLLDPIHEIDETGWPAQRAA